MEDIYKRQNIGVCWFIIHCLMFSVISVITKILNHDLNIFQIIFLQTGIGSIILFPFALNKKIHQVKLHILRSILWAGSTIIFFSTISIIGVPKAVAMSFSVPLFTTILAVLILKEVLHYHRITSLILGFIGMLIIIQPGGRDFEVESLYIILSAFLWALTDILIKILSTKGNPIMNTFSFAAFASILTMPFAIYYWEEVSLYNAALILLLSGVFILNIYSVSKAYSNADLTIMMPFSFTQLIFVSILSYILFDNMISNNTIIGASIVVISSSYISLRERKIHKKFLAKEIGKEILDIKA